MSNDKDLEDQIPAEPTDDLQAADDDFADDSEFAAEEMADDASYDEGGFGTGDYSEDDFGGEEWESYDDEGYLDDSDGGDGAAERGALFSKTVIGIGAIIAVLAGIFFMFGGQSENLGQPSIEKVSPATQVAESQKVEFHAETKVEGNDAFGVNYGQPVPQEEIAATDPPPPAGLLNNPTQIREIRNQRVEVIEYSDADYEGPQMVDHDADLPMPAPIMRAEPASPQSGGLIPLPGQQQEDSGQEMAGLDETSEDMYMSDDGLIPAQSATATQADLAKRLDDIMVRLESLDDMERTLAALETRLDQIERQPRQQARQPSSPVAAAPATRNASATRSAAPRKAPRAVRWELKSAQPGQAMIARRGETDMVSVAVGDNIAGLGRITGIYSESGQWIVQGTNGRVTN